MVYMMKNKPTYDQLVSLINYLAPRAYYETLPLLPQPRAVIEYCMKNVNFDAFPEEPEESE